MESPERPSIDRIAEFQELMYAFSRTDRVVKIPQTDRFENVAEHSYALAMTAWYLAQRIAPHLDKEKIFKYALVGDLVEVYASDTNAFGSQEEISTKAEREQAAFNRLKAEWQDFPEMIRTIEDYESKIDDESKFVYAVDKILPALIVNLGEKEQFWQRYSVTQKKFEAEKAPKIAVSEEIAAYYNEFIDWMTNPNYFVPEE